VVVDELALVITKQNILDITLKQDFIVIDAQDTMYLISLVMKGVLEVFYAGIVAFVAPDSNRL
jgi:hypothetical protein